MTSARLRPSFRVISLASFRARFTVARQQLRQLSKLSGAIRRESTHRLVTLLDRAPSCLSLKFDEFDRIRPPLFWYRRRCLNCHNLGLRPYSKTLIAPPVDDASQPSPKSRRAVGCVRRQISRLACGHPYRANSPAAPLGLEPDEIRPSRRGPSGPTSRFSRLAAFGSCGNSGLAAYSASGRGRRRRS
jgi:hypothetical protein